MRIIFILLLSFSCLSFADISICHGTTSDGSLKRGVQLPVSGKNYIGYSNLARIAGRTYVHSEVNNIIIEAYASLELSHPDKVFKYAESGFKEGGEFKPHKTHRNGLSVDFMTPVLTEDSESVHLPTHPFNKFGYDIEFDEEGNYKDLFIDYTALAAHIVALHKASIANGYDLWRVIFDPELQPYLLNTEYADYLKNHIKFSEKRSWVRHDEHYHVDFSIPCE